jgi:UPF0755 protein
MKKLLLVILTAALLLAGAGAATYQWVFSKGSKSGSPVTVAIKPGTSGAVIADDLEEKRVISSALAFRVYMKLSGINREFRAGEYGLRTGMGFEELTSKLKKGPDIKYTRVTIPEGFTLEQTATRVGEKTHISKEQFIQAATFDTIKPAAFPQGPPDGSLEGFLYPQTYFITEKEDAAVLVNRMVSQFDRETKEIDWSKSSALGLNPYQVIVVASLIEEEAKVDEERGKISAVLYNRLRMNMKLEIDATVQYITKKYNGQPLTQSDLEIDSPYNTRRYAGLPPGPIANVGATSVEAALNPAPSDALFYVLTPDCRTHVFTSDYNEFLSAKQQIPTNC